jgi:spore germination protein YaaH
VLARLRRPPRAVVTAGTGTGDTGTGTTTGGGSSTGTVTAQLSHRRCGWMNDDYPLGVQSLVANADFFDAIHPVWWFLNSDGNTVSSNYYVDDATTVQTARAHHIKLMPLIYGGNDATYMEKMFSSPASITAHVNTLVNLAVSHNYDGLEIDYEHLWSASDRPGYTAFIQQLGAAMHAQGKELSLAVPAIDVDNGQNGYDFVKLAAAADVIHLMGYDYHWLGGDHLGPLAPLGWLDSVAARIQSLGLGKSFIMGLANYGVGSGWYANSADAIKQCPANYPTTTTHMESCPYGVRVAGVSPHCTTTNGKGDIWFEDAASLAEKAQMTASHGLRGVSYYTLGGEAPGLYDALRAAYP